MDYSLLNLDDYENLPPEPGRRFAVLEDKARRNMNRIMESTDSGNLSEELRNQYMALMVSSASALGIPEVTYPEGDYRNSWDEYQVFATRLRGVVTRIMLSDALIAKPFSVQLSSVTKSKIESQIIVLRSLIKNSDMPSARKKRLIEQLDQFSTELSRTRLNFAVAMSAMALVIAGLQGTTSLLADAPSAYQTVGTIMKWIGVDKDAEERERERLGAPAPMLTPPPQASQTRRGSFDDDLDDDVPF